MGNPLATPFTEQLGIEVPLICGAMYPCTNPELVAAVSEAGGIGIVQPMSMEFVYDTDFREGIHIIRDLTDRPFGVNFIVKKTARVYEKRMHRWVDIAVDEEVPLFITALGDPTWVIERARPKGILVYHDVTNRFYAEKARDYGVDGLICINERAGGHHGEMTTEALRDELADIDLPKVCAGGIGTPEEFVEALDLGYDAVQMGTRFIATEECGSNVDYKDAIVDADPSDIVSTEKISGVPCAVIETPAIRKMGTKAGPIARWLLDGRWTKYLMRAIYGFRSLWVMRKASIQGHSYKDFYVAGKSVGGVEEVEPAGAVVRRFAEHAREARAKATG